MHAAVGVEQHRDDPHGLLRVVAAMAQGIERRGDELQASEHTICEGRRGAHEQPGHDQHQQESEGEPQRRRQYDSEHGLGDAAPDHHARARLGEAGAEQAADERVGAR